MSVIRSLPCRAFVAWWGAAALAVASAAAPAAAKREPPALTLYHRFAVTVLDDWVDVVVPLEAGAWHVGRLDGPRAKGSQLRTVLASVKLLAVGVRCQGTSVGDTYYDCKFELAAPDAAPGGIGMQRRWMSTSGEMLSRYDEHGAQTAAVAISAPEGSVPPAPSGLGSGFLGVVALDGDDAHWLRAPAIRFRFRVFSSGIVPVRFDPAGGALILSNRGVAVPAKAPGPQAVQRTAGRWA